MSKRNVSHVVGWSRRRAVRRLDPKTTRLLDYRTQGQAYIEFIIVLPLFLIIIAGVIGFGQMLYARLAMEAAVWSGARHAVATLDQDRGVTQAYLAQRYTLSGFGLDPDHAQSQVVVWGEWGRGAQIRVRACYDVPAPPVPLGDVLEGQRICASEVLPVYKWKSAWTD